MSSSNPRRTVTRSAAEPEPPMALKTTMALRKGATFHSPTSPSSSDEDYTPPRLTRAQSQLDDVIHANRRRVALTLSDIDEALAKTEALSLSDAEPKKKNKAVLRDTSLPVPRGLLGLPPVVDPTMAKDETERRVLRPRSVRRTRHASDSGLGSSLASTNDKGSASEKKSTKTAPVTRTAASNGSNLLPSLSRRAVNRIHEHTLGPLLEKPTLKDFEPIVLDIPRRIRSKEIICLRDVEKHLYFMAPEKAKTAALYLDFCLTSIRCVQATVEYLTDREQVRPGDRPYTNGYFIDLKEQIYEYGRQLAAKEKGTLADNMDLDIGDEVRLHGGIAENGRPAELVRVKKDGTAISMATGKVVDLNEAPVKFKRSLSEQLDDEEEIMRSMARRKKNATPEELAPKKCREPGCNKEFKRPCDLTKHEKTHSRPWKCPIPTCKYHSYGWPTEKEMDRHVNDKHSDAPSMYECLFKPCPYKSKRESNCKQHMEKAHGWTYVRTKTTGKGLPMKPTIQQATPQQGNLSTPSSTPVYMPTPPDENMGQGQQSLMADFPLYPSNADWMETVQPMPETLDVMDVAHENENHSPSSSASYEQYPPYQNGSTFILNDEELYAATMHLPSQMPLAEQMYDNSKMLMQQMHTFPTQLHGGAHHQMAVPPHFSPSGQENAMLYTPNSLREVDESLDDALATDGGADFQLFDAHAHKGADFELFDDMPSADMGFSQNTQPDIFQQMDMSNFDYTGFQE